MFKSILVPVDLTPKNESAVRVAEGLLAGSKEARVVLLHVIETLDLPFEDLRDFYDRLQARAMSHMEGLSRPLRSAGVSFEARVLYGDRAERIVAFAREDRSELIVMDSHRVEPGRPGRGPTTLSYRVAFLADCPVLLIKGRKKGSEPT